MFTNRLSSLSGSQIQRGMSHTRAARLLLVSIIALFAVVAPQTALAATPPQIFTFLDAGSNLIDCGSFTVREDYSIPTRVIVFDSYPDGEPINGQAHQDFNGTFTNLTTGYSLPEYAQRTIMFDYQDGTHKQVGLQLLVSLPGGGVAILDAGNITILLPDFDFITFAGKHQWFTNGRDLICAALS
jgi:hypothetical protein